MKQTGHLSRNASEISTRSEIVDAMLLCKCVCPNALETVVTKLASPVLLFAFVEPVAVAGKVLEMGCPTVPVEPVDTVTSVEEVNSPV